uniref:Uncharacterized protein n=1 Tax=Medicago truncatula TaxID=3880 RepID=I3SFL6_MEDTR|nr:unknown [Medicago truncatula]
MGVVKINALEILIVQNICAHLLWLRSVSIGSAGVVDRSCKYNLIPSDFVFSGRTKTGHKSLLEYYIIYHLSILLASNN